MIDKSILGLLTFGSNLDFDDCTPKNHLKIQILYIFLYFLGLGPWPRPSPGLDIEFHVTNAGFGCVFAELLHFSSFLLNFQAVVKSAASAASPKTKIQESRGASARQLGWRATETVRLPWIPGFWTRGGCASSRLDCGLNA